MTTLAVFLAGFGVGFAVAMEAGRHIYNARMAEIRATAEEIRALLPFPPAGDES